MEKTSNYYPTLDMMKIVCAVLVVGVHTEPFGDVYILDKMFAVITRIAVPFFFMTSSFFYFRKPISLQNFASFAKRMLSLYFSWGLIYVIVTLLRGGNLSVNQLIFQFFVQGYAHFWYIWALLVSIGLCSLLLRCVRSPGWVLTFASLLYIWGTLCSTYSAWFPLTDPIIELIGVRNGIHYGPVFVMLGYLFAHRKKPLMNTQKAILFSIGALFLLALEGVLGVLVVNAESTILWLSTPLLMYALYSACLGIELQISCEISTVFRKMSVGIYCIHPLIIPALENYGIQRIPQFVMTAVISGILSLWLIEMRKTGKSPVWKQLL